MNENILAHTVQIVVALVGNTTVAVSDLPGVIGTVYSALDNASKPPEPKTEVLPAVPVKKSVTPDAIICLECGTKHKMLKRHLKSEHGMTPEDYRAKWGLSRDYPLTAPNYAAQRSEMAKASGLGKKKELA